MFVFGFFLFFFSRMLTSELYLPFWCAVITIGTLFFNRDKSLSTNEERTFMNNELYNSLNIKNAWEQTLIGNITFIVGCVSGYVVFYFKYL